MCFYTGSGGACAVVEKKLEEGSLGVGCGLCRGPALSLVQSAAHPSPLHLLPDADRLHCATTDLSHRLQEPIERHVHAGFDQSIGLFDCTASWDLLALWPRGQLRSIW